MDRVSQLAELFKERDNPNFYAPLIGTHAGGGKLRIKNNVVLSRYKTCVQNVANYEVGTQFVVLPMDKEFIVMGRLHG